jgi:catechol 2,3-dioxygenase-like lactoylglutathione lyase family enzyme
MNVLTSCNIIAFVVTTDPVRAKEFYTRVLGLRLVDDQPGAIVFDAHGTMLRIAKVQAFVPAPHTVLGWQVTNVAGSIDLLIAAGVTFEQYPGLEQDERGIWTSPDGAKIAWFKDPSGNTLSLTEFPLA